MPLYEYRCLQCDHRFEVIQKFSDPELAVCPQCGSAVERLLSPPAIQFKGSGWYVTDYGRSGSGGANGNSRKNREWSGSESQSESKPDSKTESKADSAVR